MKITNYVTSVISNELLVKSSGLASCNLSSHQRILHFYSVVCLSSLFPQTDAFPEWVFRIRVPPCFTPVSCVSSGSQSYLAFCSLTGLNYHFEDFLFPITVKLKSMVQI